MKMSLKYSLLLKVFGILPVKKIMAQPPAETQKFFRKKDKGVQIPELQDPELSIRTEEVNGFPVLSLRHRKKRPD